MVACSYKNVLVTFQNIPSVTSRKTSQCNYFVPGKTYSKTSNGIIVVAEHPDVQHEPAERIIVDHNSKCLKKSSGQSVREQPGCDSGEWHWVAEVVNDQVNQDQDVDWPILDLDLHEVSIDPELPEVSPQQWQEAA